MDKTRMVTPAESLPGRQDKILVVAQHVVLGNGLLPPYPRHLQVAMFGMGCFWGAERVFWQQAGVWTTAVGYAAGFTPNPSYQEVCTGQTGHNEVVRVVFDPDAVAYEQLLTLFWENHDSTQGMRQGNDVGTQYRSGVYTYSDVQMTEALASKDTYQARLGCAGIERAISTEIQEASKFYFAEDAHQQYLAKNPSGYCGLGGMGVRYVG